MIKTINKKIFGVILLFVLLLNQQYLFSQQSAAALLHEPQRFTLQDFYQQNSALEQIVERIFESLSDEERVGQMFMQAGGKLGVSKNELSKLIANKQLGGILLLKGEKEEFKQLINLYDSLNKKAGGLPLIYSADGEPSLINKKIDGLRKYPKTNKISTPEEADSIASLIAQDFKDIGLHYNFAPLCDLAHNDEIIKNRSFSDDKRTVERLALSFAKALQRNQIAATAKHFPGHGIAKGDSHKQLVYIEGELNEIDVYKPLIDEGVISIMVGHIAVVGNSKYSTDSLPSTVSRRIVTDLLRNEMGFKGIIVTDGMRMKGVNYLKDPEYKAVKAGCDLLLIPNNIAESIKKITAEMKNDDAFRQQVYDSVKRIIRLKICLGLIS